MAAGWIASSKVGYSRSMARTHTARCLEKREALQSAQRIRANAPTISSRRGTTYPHPPSPRIYLAPESIGAISSLSRRYSTHWHRMYISNEERVIRINSMTH